MLKECFPFLADGPLPEASDIFEASRLVVDKTTLETQKERWVVIDKLLVALMERGLQRKLTEYVGFMIPEIWESTFIRVGWKPEWLGPGKQLLEQDYIVRAGRILVNRSIYEHMKRSTGLTGQTVLNFGRGGRE